MGIQYFYNFSISDTDDTDLESDILSAVRRSYFASFEKLRDKITYDSEGASMLYDYCLEKDKPMRWSVKNPHGGIVQEVLPSDGGRYYLCFYRGDKLFKRLLFSKLHTLLKAEYMDENGAVFRSVEPRKVQGGLCLLYVDASLPEPVVLSAEPDVPDQRVKQRLREDFTDYTAVASTNEGIVWFLSDAQIARYREFAAKTEAELESQKEISFVGQNAPLYDKINAKDFNMKRNFSASLDITDARAFGDAAESTDSAESPAGEQSSVPFAEESETVPEEETVSLTSDEQEPSEEANTDASQANPDKLIMADGAVYSYYGELDENGNRSGYGRTLTDQGRTAYEGMYLNDKRSGHGAYFYKDGTLCYSGDWSENVRHGVGVGISARDGSMHIGRWINNKPEGNGVRLSADGEIRFVCKELEDGSTVLMNYLSDDTVQISKYDREGKKISEKSVSLADF